MDILRIALERIAQQTLDDSSYDNLVKACDSFKIKSEDFLDDYEYNLYVSKSVRDYLNEVEQTDYISKAILPGQTKVVDGVTYIWTFTPNASTQYDWRVYKPASGSGLNTSKQTSKKANNSVGFVNDLFPKDLSSLKVIKTLGGSTGAQLVEDSKGNQYVMKKGSNTSNGHVSSEYMASQLYSIMGLKVPDMELYDDNGDKTLLSKFIPLTKSPTSSNYSEISKGFLVDALLANWDIYKNDNILIDSAGRVIRVDNGGSLFYRAQGSNKGLGNKIDEFDSLIKFNGHVLSSLTDEDKLAQIDELSSKRDLVLDYIKLNGDKNLESVMTNRFDDLKRLKKEVESRIKKANRVVQPRVLLPDADMYRDFTDDELKDFWSQASGSSAYGKLRKIGTHGWELLETICKSRGFDNRPEVVDSKNYWALVAQKGSKQLFRGIDNNGNKTAKDYADEFKYEDECYYGAMAYYGQGIYFHVNDGSDSSNEENTYKNSSAYSHARQYANSGGEILECVVHPSSKIARVKDLQKEIENLVVTDSQAIIDAKAEIQTLWSDLAVKKDELDNVTMTITNDIKQNMHWDEDALIMSQLAIDNTDWGKLDENGDRDYPSFDDFFKKDIVGWVTANGGTVTEKVPGSEVYVLKMPNSTKQFLFSRFRYENNAIKQKNGFSKAYNYPVKDFQDWFMNNHYSIIDAAIKKEINNIGDKVTSLKTEIKELDHKIVSKQSELDDLKKVKNPDADIMTAIYSDRGSRESVGIYAALKGYDAMIAENGNGMGNSFLIVLNRSKIIVKK